MSVHSWCRDIPRDEAVRAAEDGRQGPLPTLEEVIAGVWVMMPKSVSGSSAPKPENTVNGMRTERITLDVTHELDSPLGDWIVQVVDESLGFDEYVRVVDEAIPPAPQSRPAETRQTQAKRIGGGWWFPKSDLPSPPPPPPPAPPRVHRGSGVFDANGDEVPWEGVVAALKDERDAAIRERDSLREQLESVACRAATAENRVAELERAAKLAPAANADAGSNHAAPAASGAAGTDVAEIARLREERRSITTLLGKVESLEADNERLREERRWIPVGERLPEGEEWVDVAGLWGDSVGWHEPSGWRNVEDDPFPSEVTHWRKRGPGPEAAG